jgi:hypothetical protein
MYQRILVPYDGSATSSRGLPVLLVRAAPADVDSAATAGAAADTRAVAA